MTKRDTPVQPSLSELLSGYLRNQSLAHATGLAQHDPSGEVVPFEAGPVQPVDPGPAWAEAVAVLPFFQTAKVSNPEAPPHWANLVAAHEPVVALAFCVGNYPQLLRNLHLLLHKANVTELQPQAGKPIPVPALLKWAKSVAEAKNYPAMLVAAGAFRLAKHYDEAAAYLSTHETDIPTPWQAAWDNEKAALAWHRGQTEQAFQAWQQQPPSLPVLFNRGMAALFLGKTTQARQALTQAVAQLPDGSGWYHLGRLYLTLAAKG